MGSQAAKLFDELIQEGGGLPLALVQAEGAKPERGWCEIQNAVESAYASYPGSQLPLSGFTGGISPAASNITPANIIPAAIGIGGNAGVKGGSLGGFGGKDGGKGGYGGKACVGMDSNPWGAFGGGTWGPCAGKGCDPFAAFMSMWGKGVVGLGG